MTPNKNQFLIVVVILLIFHASVSADIIGMWLFEEAAGDRVIDASDENHEGKLEGGTKRVEGKFGKGVELSKNGFIEWESNDNFNFEESLSILIYARIDDVTPQEWVGMPRKEGQYVMAAHKVGDKAEMTLWLNTGPVVGSGLPLENIRCTNLASGITTLPHMMGKRLSFILMENRLVHRN